MRRVAMLFTVIGLAVLAGCTSQSPTDVAPAGNDTGTMNLSVPAADSTIVGGKRGVMSVEATPPSFAGWNVCSGSSTQIFGPIWDQDWKITFYLPNRSSLPSTRFIAAKNIWGRWLTYNSYALLYSHGRSGSYYRVTYVFGGNRANLFAINMFDPTNWALYYR